jgi:hypothetical protein
MGDEGFASDERRVIAAALEILERLTGRLNAGEPVPNALLADAVDGLRALTSEWPDRCERASLVTHGETPTAAAHLEVSEMAFALEALERGEAGAAGAFVTHARSCLRLLRQHAGLEQELHPLTTDHAESPLLPDPTGTCAESPTVHHFTRLLERYARWTPG